MNHSSAAALPTSILAQQLSNMLERLCPNVNDLPLIEKTLQLLLEALGGGKVSLEMEKTLSQINLDSVDAWQQALLDAEVAILANQSDATFAPMIIDKGLLYLARYYAYHSQLNNRLALLSKEPAEELNQSAVIEILNRLFPENNISPNWQKIAAALALRKRLCVISGGPGTGKTTTVLRLLAALYEAGINKAKDSVTDKSTDFKLRIRLAAPTGKAAARMQESISHNLNELNCDESIKQKLECKASTLHRLLGYKANSVNFRHNKNNPLPLDVLVIDESSMIGSSMMAKCLDALPNNARLILLGDKDQLAAVDPGSPFESMCQNFGFSEIFADELAAISGENISEFVSSKPHALADNLVFLHHSYRFDDKSGIGQLAKAINTGEYENAQKLMQTKTYPDIAWIDYKASDYRAYNSKLSDPLIDRVQLGFKSFKKSLKNENSDLEQIFLAFRQFCLLTTTHKGYCGRIEINKLCQRALSFPDDVYWYHGRPVMVSSNNYQLGLFNGDVGICLDLNSNGNMRVYFPTSEGFKDFAPSRIPVHETAFSITVHKSQGSEFNEVLFLLPDSVSSVLNKSLVYTAITRAKEKVELWGREDVFLTIDNK